MIVEMQSYQRGIDYERERIKRIIKEQLNVKQHWISEGQLKDLLEKIDDFEVQHD